MKSKTIIMSSTVDNSVRGILTIFIEDDLLKCRLRTYNLPSLSIYCKLGIYHEKEVYSANLIEKSGVYESSFVGDFLMDKDFYIALIDTGKNNQVLLSGGTYQGYYFNDNSVFLDSEEFCQSAHQPISTKQENEEKAQTNNSNFKVENNLDECEQDCDKCIKCKYKEFFYSNQNESNELKDSDFYEQNGEDINNLPDKTEIQNEIELKHMPDEKIFNITSTILPQFENLFNSYMQDEELNKLIENSKFVKIDEAGEQYSIGAIFDNDEIKFMCYAIKRENNINPPKELGENYQWLPLDAFDPLSSGYFVVFQDAVDLKIVKI